jgi:hypothetical protein
MSDENHDELSRRFHAALDMVLPRAGVEQRVLQSAAERIADNTARQPRWMPFRTTIGSALVVLAVVVLLGGALGITLALHGSSRGTATTPAPVINISPPAKASPPTPSTISYIKPLSMSFPTDSDGWVVGSGCDESQRCEPAIARTTNGGKTWALVHVPSSLIFQGSEPTVVAASSRDVWIWAFFPTGQGGFLDSHDGGLTWQAVGHDVTGVFQVQIAAGSAWAYATCGSQLCLITQPVSGGAWTNLPAIPGSVQGPYAAPNSGSTIPDLLRLGSEAWMWNWQQQNPALTRSGDGGRTWQSLSMPCGQHNQALLGASSVNQLMMYCSLGDYGTADEPREVWTSSDGGLHWRLRSRAGYTDASPPMPNVGTGPGNVADPSDLLVLNDTTAFLVNGIGDAWVTHDDGGTWASATIPNPSKVYTADFLTFADAQHGWAYAWDGGVWMTSDGGATWISQPILGAAPTV